MQTVRPELLECLKADELARLACLCKFTFAKISADIYSINFVCKWKLNPIIDWAHFQKLIKMRIELIKVLETNWPVVVHKETEKLSKEAH